MFIDLCYILLVIVCSSSPIACFEITPFIIWERHYNIYFISALFKLFIIFMGNHRVVHVHRGTCDMK